MADYSSHFSVKNIPFGIASNSTHAEAQCVTRIGNSVIFLALLAKAGWFSNAAQYNLGRIFTLPTMNEFAGLPKHVQVSVRSSIQQGVAEGRPFPPESQSDVSEVQMHLPFFICEFTDFSVAESHLLNMGEIFGGRRGLPPTAKRFPIGYQGRASSIIISGDPITRPVGQFDVAGEGVVCGPSRQLDYEFEMGAIVSKPVKPGQRVRPQDADEHIFGFVLLNDWTARDIQDFESKPAGFLASKTFGTSISPWVITTEALSSFMKPAVEWAPEVAPYLKGSRRKVHDVNVHIDLIANQKTTSLCDSSMDVMTWSFDDIVAHMTVGGCGLRTGDLLASGTLSGPAKDKVACMCELTFRGKNPVQLVDGSSRAFLEDGDEVILSAFAGDAQSGVGFGECRTLIKSAKPL